MLSQNQTEKETPAKNQKKNIYDVIEGAAGSMASKVVSISMIAMLAIAAFSIFIVKNLPDESNIDDVDAYVSTVLFAGIAQLFVIIAYEIIITLAGKRKNPLVGIIMLQVGLVVNAISIIYTQIKQDVNQIYAVISIAIGCIFPIIAILYLVKIIKSYKDNTIKVLSPALQIICIVFGSLMLFSTIVSLSGAFIHVLYTVAFLSILINSIIYFGIAGLLGAYNTNVRKFTQENLAISMSESGNVDNHISSSRCPKCNANNYEGATFCSSCGAPLGQ